jgi:hypothetical protein
MTPGELLCRGEFDWSTYHKVPRTLEAITLEAQLAAHEQEFFARRGEKARSSWGVYQTHLRRLTAVATQNPRLSLSECILKAVTDYKAGTRAGQQSVTPLMDLARFLELALPYDLRQYYRGTQAGYETP